MNTTGKQTRSAAATDEIEANGNEELSSGVLCLGKVLEDEYRMLHGELPADCRSLHGEISDEKLIKRMYACVHLRARGTEHETGKPRTALCLSGGGIRSGAFSLGILQGLAKYNLLDRFDYLSTVSGGGYIGSWLTAWIHREGGLARVTAALKPKDAAANATFVDNGTRLTALDTAADAGVLDPEPEPIRHLRAYSNFLTPRTGWLSADAWTFGAIILRNILINWTALIPLLLAVLCIPRLAASGIGENPAQGIEVFVLILGIVAGAIGIAYIGLNQPSASDTAKEFPRQKKPSGLRRQSGFLWLCLFPLMVCAISLTSCWAWHPRAITEYEFPFERLLHQRLGIAHGGSADLLIDLCVIGVVLNLLGWLILFAVRRRLAWSTLATAALAVFTGAIGGGLFFALTRAFGFIGDPQKIGGLPFENNKLFYACFAFPLFLGLFLIAIAFITATTSRDFWRLGIKDEDREWWSRCSGWLLIAAVMWMLFSGLVFFGPWLLINFYYTVSALGIGSGLLTLLGGRSAATPATGNVQPKSWVSLVMQHAVTLAAPLFLLFFVIVLALATDLLLVKAAHAMTRIGGAANPFADHQPLLFDSSRTLLARGGGTHLYVVSETPLRLSASVAAALLLIGYVAGRYVINLNKFSLHYAYRNRLVRAFLGASRRKADRNPNPFTGFDQADNIYMHELRPGLLSVDSFTDKKAFIRKLRSGKPDIAATNEDGLAIKPTDRPRDAQIRRYIYINLSSDTRSRLDAYAEDGDDELTQNLVVSLVGDLNKILGSFAFHRFLDGELTSAEKSVDGTRQALLTLDNRRKLESAFTEDEVARYDPPPEHKLMHVINTTLNLVAGDNLAWQQRRAAPFTFSPLHAGNSDLGYRITSAYGGAAGISLGTAATISGAAVNPNMGYNSSPLVTFILTLFNVRLGWWLGNPGIKGDKVYRYSHPQSAIRPILSEAFGLTDAESRYINLSDGGHFENLALYEMVRRRCHFIVVVDGSQDGECKFDDLGNAVRKIRVDLGITINFADGIDIHSRRSGKQGKYCAVAEIDYASVDGSAAQQGTLVYIKPSIYGDEPPDIFNYAQQNADFPHEGSTLR